jgi:hypothetical protein
MTIAYWVADEDDEKHRADSEDDAHQWASANLPPDSFYTVTKIGPSRVGSAKQELFRTPSGKD